MAAYTRLGCIAFLVAACGDNTAGPAEPAGPVTFLHQNVPVPFFAFPLTRPDGHASALFVIRNDNDTTLPAVDATISADGFTIDAASTCGEHPDLVPHDLCTVLVRWDAGTDDVNAELVVDSGGTQSRLPIQGLVGGGATIAVDTSQIDFGIVPLGSTATASVRLTNTGASAMMLFPSATGPFTFGFNDCPFFNNGFVLAAGASCTPTLGFTAGFAAGWVAGSMRFGDATVALDAYAVRGIVLQKTGAGSGRIVSVPHGIDCGTDCGGQSAYIIGDATLTETPDDGSHFAGWKSTCGTDPACVIAERSAGGVVATFAGADAAAIALTIDGSARGELVVGSRLPPNNAFDMLTTCVHACTTYAPIGGALEIFALTPSHFGGWTGDCPAADPHCLHTIDADLAATATFDKDEREVAALLPQLPRNPNMSSLEKLVVAFAPDGDLVIGSTAGVTKLGVDGTIRWFTATATENLPTLPIQITTSSAGDIYFVSVNPSTNIGGLAILSPTGAVRSAGFSQQNDSCAAPKVVVAPNGDIGMLHRGVVDGKSTNLFDVVRGNSVVFEIDLGLRCAVTVAVGSDGVYQFLIAEQTSFQVTSYVVQRRDAAGVQLPGSGPFAMKGGLVAVAADASGALAFHVADCCTGAVGTHTFGRILRDGTFGFTTTTITESFDGLTGIASDPAGNVIVAREADTSMASGGLHLEQRTPTGTVLWQFEKSPDGPVGRSVFEVNDFAASSTGRVAVAGAYTTLDDFPLPWIAVYQIP